MFPWFIIFQTSPVHCLYALDLLIWCAIFFCHYNLKKKNSFFLKIVSERRSCFTYRGVSNQFLLVQPMINVFCFLINSHYSVDLWFMFSSHFCQLFHEKPTVVMPIIGKKTAKSVKTTVYYVPKKSIGCPFSTTFHDKINALSPIFCPKKSNL